MTSRTVRIRGGSPAIVEHLREPLSRALGDRRTWYDVAVELVGRSGEVVVSISGTQGRLPLLFQKKDLEPEHVFRVVKETVTRLAF
jgi:hypothetical protein